MHNVLIITLHTMHKQKKQYTKTIIGSTQLSARFKFSPTTKTHFAETDSSRLFTEALTAEVKSVFADDTSLVGAQSAGRSLSAIVLVYALTCVLTIDGCLFRTCEGERTRWRRESFWEVI